MQICFVGKDNQERQSEKSLAPHVASFFEAGKAIIKKLIRILVKIDLVDRYWMCTSGVCKLNVLQK